MNWKRLIGWPWFVKAEKREAVTDLLWQDAEWFSDARNGRLAFLAAKRTALIDQLAKAKAQKKARKHIYAALEANTRERLRIEGGE